MLSAQQANDSKVQRFLNRRQLRLEVLEACREEICPLLLQIGVRKLGHQNEHEFRILQRGDAVNGLQVFEIGIAQLGGGTASTSKKYGTCNNKQQNTANYSDSQKRRGFHQPSFCFADVQGEETWSYGSAFERNALFIANELRPLSQVVCVRRRANKISYQIDRLS